MAIQPTSLNDGVGGAFAGVFVGSMILRVKEIEITAAMIVGTEIDTGFDLPANALLVDAWINCRTAEATGATKTIDLGLLSSESGGDADGFMDGLSVAATGMKIPNWVQTTGANNNYLGAAATHTIGALLTGLLIAGEDIAAGGDGFASRRAHASKSVTSKSVSITTGSAFTEFKGSILLHYLDHND